MAKTKDQKGPTDKEDGVQTSIFASKTVDPLLATLFASSSGPVKVPEKVAVSISQKRDRAASRSQAQLGEEGDFEDTSARPSTGSDLLADSRDERPRKRRRVSQDEDLEATYLDRLAREDELEATKRTNLDSKTSKQNDAVEDESSFDELDSSAGLEDGSDDEPIPQHETQGAGDQVTEAEKARRTVFVGNVSTSAIKSKSARRTLISHLKTALDSKLGEKIESIRFRSTAFVSSAGPKKAAYAKKELMDETMQSTNAYVVLSTDAGARKLANRLNGSVILDRHIRVDNLGNPASTDHRRCVFVGNLSFVDKETVIDETENGAQKRTRGKEPADIEEGLWRTFSKMGKVESVRVVRDKETRVSKGIAYVQFEDENGVEAALSLNEKKFPPMLPRRLRVMRAKKTKEKRPAFDRPLQGRNGPGKARVAGGRAGRPVRGKDAKVASGSGPDRPVFEGYRASSNNKPSMKPRKKHASKPTTRSSRRGAAFKASGRDGKGKP